MIIDCHGHYTTEPKPFMDYRKAQVAAFEEGVADHVVVLSVGVELGAWVVAESGVGHS